MKADLQQDKQDFSTAYRRIRIYLIYEYTGTLLSGQMSRYSNILNIITAKRFAHFRFLPETGNLKYPNNPVNPV